MDPNWIMNYEGLYGSPSEAQAGWKKSYSEGGATPGGYLYWRDLDTGDKRFPAGTGEPFMVATNKPPDWAKEQSEAIRTAQPGKEFGEKSESMMDYLKAVAEGKRSASLEEGERMSAEAMGAAKGRLASGPWSTAAARQVGLAGGQAQMEIGAQAHQASIQEKQDAQRAYMAAVDAQRQQDVSAQLALEELARRYREMGLSDEQARAAALRQYSKDLVSRSGIYEQGKAAWEERNASTGAAVGSMIGTGLGMLAGGMVGGPGGAMIGGSLGGMAGKGIGGEVGSDRRLKAGIKSADRKIEDFLKSMGAKEWKWKADGAKDVGVVAQDVERSAIGKSLVERDESGMRGIAVEPRRFSPVVLASLANLDKRIRKLER